MEGRVDEVTDEPLYRDRVCGIDIGKAPMVATIRVPSDKDPARRASETREFATTKRGVLALADWMRCWQVPPPRSLTSATLNMRPTLDSNQLSRRAPVATDQRVLAPAATRVGGE